MQEVERFLAEMDAVEAKRGAGKPGDFFSNSRPSADLPPPRTAAFLSAPPPPLAERDNCAAAKELMDKGQFDQAIEVYKRCIVRCDGILANGNYNMALREERRNAADGIIEVAFRYILTNADEKAVGACEHVISTFSNLPTANIRLAHVRMLAGNRVDARAVYCEYRAMKATPQLTYAELIIKDFKAMREHNRQDDLMDEIESQFILPGPPRRQLIR